MKIFQKKSFDFHRCHKIHKFFQPRREDKDEEEQFEECKAERQRMAEVLAEKLEQNKSTSNLI